MVVFNAIYKLYATTSSTGFAGRAWHSLTPQTEVVRYVLVNLKSSKTTTTTTAATVILYNIFIYYANFQRLPSQLDQ